MGNKVKGGRMTEDASVIKVSSRVFSRTRLEVGEGGRVTSRSRYTFSITRWIYSWHPVLRLTSPSAASRKSWRGGGGRGGKLVEATRGIPPRQLLPPRSILIIVMKFPGAARSRDPLLPPRLDARCLFCPPEMPPPIIISMRKAMRLFSDISKSDQGEKKKGDSEKIRYWFRSMMKFSFRVSQFAYSLIILSLIIIQGSFHVSDCRRVTRTLIQRPSTRELTS